VSLPISDNDNQHGNGHGKTSVALGAFMRPVSIHTGAWAIPAMAGPISIWAYQRLIQKLEAGKFDGLLMAHHLPWLTCRSMRKAQTHRHSFNRSRCCRTWQPPRTYRADRDRFDHLR